MTCTADPLLLLAGLLLGRHASRVEGWPSRSIFKLSHSDQSYAWSVDMRWGFAFRLTIAILIVALLLGVVIYFALNPSLSFKL